MPRDSLPTGYSRDTRGFSETTIRDANGDLIAVVTRQVIGGKWCVHHYGGGFSYPTTKREALAAAGMTLADV